MVSSCYTLNILLSATVILETHKLEVDRLVLTIISEHYYSLDSCSACMLDLMFLHSFHHDMPGIIRSVAMIAMCNEVLVSDQQ